MRSFVRRFALGLLLTLAVLAVAVGASARRGDKSLWPAHAGEATHEIVLVSHGYHAGIIISVDEAAVEAARHGLAAVAYAMSRFAGFERLEIGWGEEAFYQGVPVFDWSSLPLALRALFRPGNSSVLHVAGLVDPRATFPRADLVSVTLGSVGFARMVRKLDATFARGQSGLPQELGRGLYGTSLFFRANGTFNVFMVCNHWVADLLDAAGVPTSPVLATLPAGLLLDLEWRAGLHRLPRS
ncbi:MAG: DUF2459 domain-containing protein [Xanthobacteraceae bacterium]